ncbi:MAG: 50S ribosomal protein L24 [Selenomonadaceae bacterium]|nr:50S ribosomal protein L24 [Quinella sp. 1Q5]MBQ3435009.1 50S ribosomal protein L24 [Selenomonadaceae bacterium]MBQ6758948.1 50S ribosomal protein L24 [Selenomonadaceae bacterium]MBR0102318.1 50S ribosomal protein L24 [Selenomonadaceae bacterium]MBR2775138.1 50S ribosomal protein L24 [Selenomonadaceae bacterium]
MSLIKLHVKKGDTVVVLSGKDKGKQGKVISAMPKAGKVVVEGVNKVKRHSKPSLKVPQGGIITKEMPLHACKVQLVCPACNKPTRIGHKDVNGKNSRVCKKCGEVIE